MHIILAPHLDDEVIGCYSILRHVEKIIYYQRDHRTPPDSRYQFIEELDKLPSAEDILYLPSHYDYHPKHKVVRAIGLNYAGKKMYYSVEMNTPWLQEEEDPKAKKELFQMLYPTEVMRDDKYWLFKSIQPFDEIIWAVAQLTFEEQHAWEKAPDSISFLRNTHRHLFYVQAHVQQHGRDRDVEYFTLKRQVQSILNQHVLANWGRWGMSCEQVAAIIKTRLEVNYTCRLVKVSVYEDDENGCLLE